MIRGLYTAASGMTAQQQNIDVISNNIANVNTTGFKQDRAEFQDLMYQSLNYTAGATSSQTSNPTGIDVGLGVRTSGIQKNFSQGSLKDTGNKLDIAITGDGFFKLNTPSGETVYSRDGSFKLDSEGNIVNGQGYTLDPQITFPVGTTKISIGEDGIIKAIPPGERSATTYGQLTLATFINPAGLSPLGNNLYSKNNTSGDEVIALPGQNGIGAVKQGMLETSNVQLVTEMVNLIAAQRAYESNSKSITTTDTMLQTVNQLKK